MDHTQFFQNSILDFYFSIGRVSIRKTDIEHYRLLTVLMTKFDKIVFYVKNSIGEEMESPYIKYFDLLYKLILFSRDITNGLGERTLSHMMLFIWYKYFPVHAITILNIFPQWSHDKNSVGSWRDIPDFCVFVKHFAGESCPLIDICIGLMNHQLDLDSRIVDCSDLSLVSKWIPRETSKKVGWMYARFVIQWFQSMNGKDYFKANNNDPDWNQDKFQKKLDSCKRLYRHTVQKVCTKLDIIESKQCQRKWDLINPDNVSKTTLMRQQNAFLNIYCSGNTRLKSEFFNDRINCKNKFTIFYENRKKKSETNIENRDKLYKKGIYSKKHFGIHLGSIVKNVLETKSVNPNYYHIPLWRQVHTSIQKSMHRILPMIDLTAYKHSCFHDSIGISCMLAQTSSIDSRMIAYHNNTPSWIKLQDLDNELDNIQYARDLQSMFSRIVQLSIDNNDNNDNTEHNIIRAFEMICKGFIETNTPTIEVSKMICIVLSPFNGLQQLSQNHADITTLFHNAGYDCAPHIVYWNMAGKVTIDSGLWSIHSLKEMQNCTLLAGGSSTILRHISSFNTTDWTSINSYDFLEKLLEKYVSL